MIKIAPIPDEAYEICKKYAPDCDPVRGGYQIISGSSVASQERISSVSRETSSTREQSINIGGGSSSYSSSSRTEYSSSSNSRGDSFEYETEGINI